MKQTIWTVLVLLGFVLAVGPVPNAGAADRVPSGKYNGPVTPHAPGVVYIKVRAGSHAVQNYKHVGVATQSVGASAFSQVLDRLQATATVPFDADAKNDAIAQRFGIDRMYVIYFANKSIDADDALQMLLASGEVEGGSVRYLFPITLSPNDKYLSSQYAVTNMHLKQAWDITTGDSTILIADVDDGFNTKHEDLKNAIKIGYDAVGDVDATTGEPFQPDNDPTPDYLGNSHGSHTGGCIAASGNNNLGIAGSGYGCRLIAIKAAGNDQNASIAGGYEGIHYASTHGARVINCSWGGPVSGDQSFANSFLLEAQAHNALVVAASGNGNASGQAQDVDATPFYPACGPGVLCVGATDPTDAPASFSNYGSKVGVWAPGVQILSCTYPGTTGATAYNAEDGTSFACPLTAGVAGLITSLHPEWPPQFVARQIHLTADNAIVPDAPELRPKYWGRVNAYAALTAAAQPGLLPVSYVIDQVPSDSLRGVDTMHTLTVTFKNVVAAGSNIKATLVAGTGYKTSSTSVSLGSVGLGVSVNGTFQIARNNVYSSGLLPVRFDLTDGADYDDTITMYIPLAKIAGFTIERNAVAGTGIKRISNSAAWACFGSESSSTSGSVIYSSFATETANVWSDTVTLWNRSQSPYDMDAADSLAAWFGTGPRNTSLHASVIRTTNGGTSFSAADVSSFTPFVNTVHFFEGTNGQARTEGIIIGDPKSQTSINAWGIGRSTDGGKTWLHVTSAPNIVKVGEASWNNATTWLGDKGWFGTNSQRIWRTTDRGLHWVPTSTPTSYLHCFSIAMDSSGMVGFACFRPASTSTGGATTGSGGMCKTTDGGATWKKFTTLPVSTMVPGVVCFVPGTHTAIVTSDSGIYRTADSGAHWSPIGVPLGFDAANAAAISAYRGEGKLSVSVISSQSGIATYTESSEDIIIPPPPPPPPPPPESVEEEVLQQLHFTASPNPFQQDIAVSFMLDKPQHARLTIIDPLGREVAELLNAVMSGAQTATFHATSLAAGTYYAVLVTDNGPITRAISLVK